MSVSRTFPGMALVQARAGVSGDKVYLCANGARHYVPSIERLADYGVQWPSDLTQVSDEVIRAFRIAGWLPARFPAAFDERKFSSSTTIREYMAAHVKGIGLEVGAGASPFPVPLECTVLYGDHVPHGQLVAELYPGQREFELVKPDLITDFSTLAGVADGSLDFVIGCHVIEHVFDPIGAIVNAYRVLKPGGTLLLVIPDRERTFDRTRPLTSLEHLILDHKSPDPKRDYGHYEEFYELAFVTPPEQLRSKVDHEFGRRGDLHAHVWDYGSFGELVEWVRRDLTPWSKVWSHETLGHPQHDIEFYFSLTK